MQLSDTRANNYLQSLLKICFIYKKEINAIILFGSHARREASALSDVDILIVLNESNKKVFNYLASKLRYIEMEWGYTQAANNVLELFLANLNIATGMFKSWFICSREDLLHLKFSKITKTNPLLGKLFVPAKLILFNIQKEGIILYGDNEILQSFAKIPQPKPQIFKSFLLNEIIALCALGIRPFTKRSIFYTLESIKWSKFTLNKKEYSLLKENMFLTRYLKIYDKVKTTGISNPRLIIVAPYIVYKLHALSRNNN